MAHYPHLDLDGMVRALRKLQRAAKDPDVIVPLNSFFESSRDYYEHVAFYPGKSSASDLIDWIETSIGTEMPAHSGPGMFPVKLDSMVFIADHSGGSGYPLIGFENSGEPKTTDR